MTWYTPKAELTASSGPTPHGDFLAGKSARATWAAKQSNSRVLSPGGLVFASLCHGWRCIAIHNGSLL